MFLNTGEVYVTKNQKNTTHICPFKSYAILTQDKFQPFTTVLAPTLLKGLLKPLLRLIWSTDDVIMLTNYGTTHPKHLPPDQCDLWH